MSLAPLTREIISELESEIEGRKIEWRVGQLPSVRCNRGLIKQALTNLLSNAVKYTRPRERAVVEVGERIIDGLPAIFVRDNGVGFDMRYADKLFAPFQRLHREQDFEGTGIGLATVRRIVDKHRGRIWANSDPGFGTTFSFTIGSEVENPTESQQVAVA